jgi:PAS domain S-box-containing protein
VQPQGGPEQGASALRARLESGRFARLEVADDPDASRAGSILESIQRLKEQILDKDRIINAKTGELVATRDYLRGVFEALADAVLVIDVDGTVEFANLAAHELLGYRPDELVGRAASTLWADREQGARFAQPGLDEALRAGAFQRADMLLSTRDGRSIPVSWSASVLRAGARATGLVGVARDVRVERRLEEEKVRTVQALAASVAHEIRNPLGAIQSSVGLLRRDLDVQGEDKTLLDIVYDETHRIGRIVTQFLDFARPVRPCVEEVDLGLLLREVVLLAEQDERAKTRQVLLHVEEPLELLQVDPGQVKQVVWNLLSNALDAAKEMIAVRARALSGGPGGVEVRVADDGPGMQPEVLARCFEPFRTTKAQGTGLGLAICKRILDAHHGALRLESAPGQGTAACFTLPRDGGA